MSRQFLKSGPVTGINKNVTRFFDPNDAYYNNSNHPLIAWWDAGDIDTGTAKVNGKFLKYNSSEGKWVGDDATAASVFKTISVSGQDDVVADAAEDTLTIAASSGISVTTTAASDTITFGVDIDSATDGTSITIADTDKLLIDDSGTTKYVNASQVETYINPKGKAIAMAIVFG